MKCKISKKIRIIDISVIILVILFSLFLIIGYRIFQEELTTQIAAYGLVALFIISALLEFIPQIIHPYFPMLAAVSSGINIHLALLATILGSLTGAISGFSVGKKQGTVFICSLIKEKTINKVFKFWEKYGYFFVLIAALSPLPYYPIIFGSLDMPNKDFLKFGLIPRIIGFLILGYGSYYGLINLL
jgi:membrane protein DedA with SNARE-associated domain